MCYSPKREELYICTTKDVRAFDIFSGSCRRICTGCVPPTEDIAHFALDPFHDRFVVSNAHGKVSRVQISDSVASSYMRCASSVTAFAVDVPNKFVLIGTEDVLSLCNNTTC